MQDQEAGGRVRAATYPVLTFGFSVEPGPGPGCESGAACCYREVGSVSRKRVSTPVHLLPLLLLESRELS